MSDSENYFSDSDKSENNDTPLNEEEYSDEEYDEETRRIIFSNCNTSNNYDIPAENIMKKKKKKKIPKEKKNMSLLDFKNKIEESKPKKWKSKRFHDKKEELGISNNNKAKRRCFNTILPPPTYKTFRKEKEKREKVDVSNQSLFPSLETISKTKKQSVEVDV